MRIFGNSDQIVNQGTLDDGSAWVNYYTTAPAPTQWAAIGVMCREDDFDRPGMTRRMLVGTGQTEKAAIAELELRFMQLQYEHRQRMHRLKRNRVQSATGHGVQQRSIGPRFNQREIPHRPGDEAGQSPPSSP